MIRSRNNKRMTKQWKLINLKKRNKMRKSKRRIKTMISPILLMVKISILQVRSCYWKSLRYWDHRHWNNSSWRDQFLTKQQGKSTTQRCRWTDRKDLIISSFKKKKGLNSLFSSLSLISCSDRRIWLFHGRILWLRKKGEFKSEEVK